MIVIDCNTAYSLATNSEESNAIKMLLIKGEKAIAPDLFYAELAHTLEKNARYGVISRDNIPLIAQDALEFVDEIVSSEDLFIEATNEAFRLKHSSYDMLYFVLARRNAATLFTLDQKLQKLCLENGVNCIFTEKDL